MKKPREERGTITFLGKHIETEAHWFSGTAGTECFSSLSRSSVSAFPGNAPYSSLPSPQPWLIDILSRQAPTPLQWIPPLMADFDIWYHVHFTASLLIPMRLSQLCPQILPWPLLSTFICFFVPDTNTLILISTSPCSPPPPSIIWHAYRDLGCSFQHLFKFLLKRKNSLNFTPKVH